MDGTIEGVNLGHARYTTCDDAMMIMSLCFSIHVMAVRSLNVWYMYHGEEARYLTIP